MIYLFTDFGWAGPYVGEMKAVLSRDLPDVTLIDLMHDAPIFDPKASAYLLAALSKQFRAGDICLGVIDPGVGDENRRVVMLEIDDVCYIGPDNGLFAVTAQKSSRCVCHEIIWRPELSSYSFHGRDVFAPVASRLCRNIETASRIIQHASLIGFDWSEQLAEAVYIDHYGNIVTGISAKRCTTKEVLCVANYQIRYAQTFSRVEVGGLFWYENSMGLVEIAANGVNAAALLSVGIGTKFSFVP